jgi:peptidylprolyl isomerase
MNLFGRRHSVPPGVKGKTHGLPVHAGAGGFPAWGIMPNSELKFEIEVLSIQ